MEDTENQWWKCFKNYQGNSKSDGELYFLTGREKHYGVQSRHPLLNAMNNFVLGVIYNNHKGNCNRASVYVAFQKYYRCCLKCMSSHSKHSSHPLTAKRIQLLCWAWHFPKLWEFVIKIKTHCSGRGELQEHQEPWGRLFICSPIWQDVKSVSFSVPWNAEVTSVFVLIDFYLLGLSSPVRPIYHAELASKPHMHF